MILAFDTYYFEERAKTVCITFQHWDDTEPFTVIHQVSSNSAAYQPGEFYKRELPGILSLCASMSLNNVEAILIDGFVFLDDNGKPGLGAHLFRALNGAIPVIGVAKSNFATVIKGKRLATRGKSKKPLFISAIGIDLDEAANRISNMSGPFRVPTILKRLDQLTREQIQTESAHDSCSEF